jgi:hypothetical protein
MGILNMIANVIQRGNTMHVLDEKGHQIGTTSAGTGK